MVKFYFLLFMVFGLHAPVFAFEPEEFFFYPRVALGYNVAQGSNLMAGFDAGYGLSEQLALGIGGYYSAGEHPEHDRELGGGPFGAFVQPLTDFLTVQVRQEIDYVDQNALLVTPTAKGESYSHRNQHGVIAATSLSIHLALTRNLGLSGGYRAVVPLVSSDIANGRSGSFLGVAIGI